MRNGYLDQSRSKTFKPSKDTRLVFVWGKSDRYGFEVTADFTRGFGVAYGWGVVLMIWHYYVAVDWWRIDRSADDRQ